MNLTVITRNSRNRWLRNCFPTRCRYTFPSCQLFGFFVVYIAYGLLNSPFAHGDTVILKTGKRFEGTIVVSEQSHVEIETNSMGFRFNRRDISSIENGLSIDPNSPENVRSILENLQRRKNSMIRKRDFVIAAKNKFIAAEKELLGHKEELEKMNSEIRSRETSLGPMSRRFDGYTNKLREELTDLVRKRNIHKSSTTTEPIEIEFKDAKAERLRAYQAFMVDFNHLRYDFETLERLGCSVESYEEFRNDTFRFSNRVIEGSEFEHWKERSLPLRKKPSDVDYLDLFFVHIRVANDKLIEAMILPENKVSFLSQSDEINLGPRVRSRSMRKASFNPGEVLKKYWINDMRLGEGILPPSLFEATDRKYSLLGAEVMGFINSIDKQASMLWVR